MARSYVDRPQTIAGSAGPYHDHAYGYARVYSGRTGNPIFDLPAGPRASSSFAYSVTGVGDVSGDGLSDLLVGDSFDDHGGEGAGAAWLYSGGDGSILFASFGASADHRGLVAGLGDLNRDGVFDFAIATGQHGTDNPARATVYSGRGCQASATSYGAGWPGRFGVPTMVASAAPILCSEITVDLLNSSGVSTRALVLVGSSPAAIPTALDGTLLVIPAAAFQLSLPANGVSFLWAVPCDSSLCGRSVYLQALEADGAASQGVSFTPGLQLTLGSP